MCECARCREVFTTLGAFDRHQETRYGGRPAVICHDPAERGLVCNRAGRWHFPATDRSRERLAKMRALQAGG